MNKLPDDLPDCMVFLLGKAYQKAHADFKKRLVPYNLTNMQHLVLEGLWYKQSTTAAELGKMLILDKATLSGVLDRMVQAGWIIKKADPDDARFQLISTTKKANDIKKILLAERQTANHELLQNFSIEEKLLFKRMVKDLIEKN
ncbi:MAG: MarR family transcriptional regulator [Desulfobacteraceae bacterium]|nr:MarR family transcriptional regulator [Desulfobacteraceae bacterium]